MVHSLDVFKDFMCSHLYRLVADKIVRVHSLLNIPRLWIIWLTAALWSRVSVSLCELTVTAH